MRIKKEDVNSGELYSENDARRTLQSCAKAVVTFS